MESVKRLEEQSAAKQENHGHRKVKVGLFDNGTDQKLNSQVLHGHLLPQYDKLCFSASSRVPLVLLYFTNCLARWLKFTNYLALGI